MLTLQLVSTPHTGCRSWEALVAPVNRISRHLQCTQGQVGSSDTAFRLQGKFSPHLCSFICVINPKQQRKWQDLTLAQRNCSDLNTKGLSVISAIWQKHAIKLWIISSGQRAYKDLLQVCKALICLDHVDTFIMRDVTGGSLWSPQLYTPQTHQVWSARAPHTYLCQTGHWTFTWLSVLPV